MAFLALPRGPDLATVCNAWERPGNAKTKNIISHFALTHRMTNSQRLAKVRARLLRWIADHEPTEHKPIVHEPVEQTSDEQEPSQGDDRATQDDPVAPPDSSILRESILIRGEFFCGRRFYTANYSAVWFVEEDQLKIYRNSGELLCILAGSQIEEECGIEPASELPSILKLPRLDTRSAEARESERRAA